MTNLGLKKEKEVSRHMPPPQTYCKRDLVPFSSSTDTNDCFVLCCIITLYCTVFDSCDFVLHYIFIISPTFVSILMVAKSKVPKHVFDMDTLVILTIQLCYD